MQGIDAQHRQTHAIVQDNPHQLGERCRAIPRAAQRGGQRRHQVIKRITDFLPALVDIEERFNLQHRANPAVTGTLVSAFEQPAVNLLTLKLAGGDGLLKGGLRVVQQIPHQPQVQRVDLGNVALIRQVIRARTVALIEFGQALVRHLVTA